ncbi:Altered inheritance of mitochondria protein 6-like protein [Colletotrichum aenigma]|uniref:Altered inheritance of mitochondria protein 6-like protein n=1 Tax=Colletotrichum aenigma TaxID=1215731 RepID=UPI0018727AF7|nr:Altered inheritance of mitochondria protein 6-like protein [Colletotrichum aenigma]KAF5521956.1 Altered inheritance of mitochondria protein 6-like protein [Colletotrichum aenigma]
MFSRPRRYRNSNVELAHIRTGEPYQPRPNVYAPQRSEYRLICNGTSQRKRSCWTTKPRLRTYVTFWAVGCYGSCALIIGILFYCLILRPPRETSLQSFQEIFFKAPEDSGYGPKDYVSTWLNNATFHATPAHCHSHNDYWRPVPLFSALSVGCIGIEADVWLKDGDLLVGHDTPSLSPTRTLKSLYLDPLEEILDAQNRKVTERNATKRGVFSLQDDAQIILLIDVKTDAKETWPVVLRQLEPLREKQYLTSHNSSASSDAKTHLAAPLIVVGTGNLDMATLVANHTDATTTYHEYHDTFLDAPLNDLPTTKTNYNTTNSVYASASFKQAIGSVRLGFSRTQREKLRSQVQAAKSLGLQPRYWDIPDWPLKYRDYIWTELRAEGVEILSVDNVKHVTGGVWYGAYFADAVAMTVISPATFLVMSVVFWRAVWYWRYM